uniref:Uncharacterized protein n=1 Tax=Amphimedon queenslandica TaxID=400682 RepID=A0A1X7U8Z8_AMPQE
MKGINFENTSYDSTCNDALSILLESVLKNRSHKVGVLICAANSIKKLKLNSFSDFGEQCHTKNSEPYFYESAYLYPNDDFDSQLGSPIAIPVDTNGIAQIVVSSEAGIECEDDEDQEDFQESPCNNSEGHSAGQHILPVHTTVSLISCNA